MTSLRSAFEQEQLFTNSPNQFSSLPLLEFPQQWHRTDHFPTPQSMLEGEHSADLVRQLAYSPHPSFYRLGDPDLPTAPFREASVNTVIENQTSVISSETGSGKSSQIPLYLLEAGFPRIFVSQPRIIAARNLMYWARQNLGKEYEGMAGYLTGNAADSDCPEGARLIYVTEDKLFKMVNRGLIGEKDVIINDEAHERGIGTIVLLARLLEILPDNPDMRLVTSSATIDTDKFAEYLGPSPYQPAPVLILPGRTHPVTYEETDENVGAAMQRYIEKGLNVMGFEPGIKALYSSASRAQRRTSGTVHHLYGDQSPWEQAKALAEGDGNHVVSSRVGEASLTPPGKDVVVDSGQSNIGGYEAGVRVLKTVFSSVATLLQRRGRVGRTKPGHYVLATPDDSPPPPAYEDRPAYDPPAIENSSVASYILELLMTKRHLKHLRLLERPTHENYQYDETLLKRLGAVAMGEDGEPMITEIGRHMTDLPLDVPLARMVVEARQPSEDAGVDVSLLRLQVSAAAAIHQVNGILNLRQGSRRRYLHRKSYQEVLSSDRSSDVVFALDVFTWLFEKQREMFTSGEANAGEKFDKLLEDNDILPNRYYKALTIYEELCRRQDLEPLGLQKPNAAHKSRIIACQIAGAEELFVQKSKLMHMDIRGDRRTLGRRTTITPNLAHLVVGTAFDLRGFNSAGRFYRKFIVGGSVVTSEQLIQHASHRITRQNLGFGVSRNGKLVERQALLFDGELLFDRREAVLRPTVETRIALVHAMMTGKAPSAHHPDQIVPFHPGTPNAMRAINQWKRAEKLEHKSGLDLDVEDRYLRLIKRVIEKSLKDAPLDVTDPGALDAYIPKRVLRDALVDPRMRGQLSEIDRQAPDAIAVSAGDGGTKDLPVTWKNGLGYVTIPRDLKLTVTREDFAALRANRDIKLRVSNGKYQPAEAVFALLDEQRVAEAAKHARRQEHRLAAARRDPTKPTRHEQRSDVDDQIGTQLKAQAKALLSKRPPKGLPAAIRRQKLRQKTEKLRKQQAVA